MRRILVILLIGIAAIGATCCLRMERQEQARHREQWAAEEARRPAPPPAKPSTPSASTPLAAAAVELTRHKVTYDPAYVKIPYPGGDVPPDRGVCADVIVRAYRKLGIDLQKEVHEDMAAHFDAYPKLWGLKKPDPNIDHRRVPNLMTWLRRQGASLSCTRESADYAPGDVVAWDLGGGTLHIGIVIGPGRIVHNIGQGQVAENVLFAWKIIGHYRYRPS